MAAVGQIYVSGGGEEEKGGRGGLKRGERGAGMRVIVSGFRTSAVRGHVPTLTENISYRNLSKMLTQRFISKMYDRIFPAKICMFYF